MYQSDSAPWLEFFAWNTDGTAKTDLVYNTSGISIVVVRDNQANSAALTLSAASGPTDWAAGKFHAMGGNKYRVGIATASISSFTGKISVEGSYTGGVITGVTEYVTAYNPAGNPNTIAPATLTNVTDARDAILAKLPAALIGGRMDSHVGAMATDSLTAEAISAAAGAELAALVETYIVNEGDATAVMQAIANLIAEDWVAGDASPLAIAAAVRTNLATELARIDAAISTRLATAGYTAPATPNNVSDARDAILAKLPAALEGGRIAAALDSAITDQIDNIENASGYILAVLAGACADPQTASETYAITVFGSTFTVDMAGQTSTGTRTAPTLTKS